MTSRPAAAVVLGAQLFGVFPLTRIVARLGLPEGTWSVQCGAPPGTDGKVYLVHGWELTTEYQDRFERSIQSLVDNTEYEATIAFQYRRAESPEAVEAAFLEILMDLHGSSV